MTLNLSKPTDRVRGPIARGLASGAVDAQGGDQAAGLITQTAVITRGEALGHGVWIDSVMLSQVADAINKAGKSGIKARFTHPGLSSDGLGSYLGRFKNAKIDGDIVRADLHFSKSAHNTPDGNLAEYVMSLAESDPQAFGNSIVFRHDRTAEDAFHNEHHKEVEETDGNGRPVKRLRFRSPDEKNAEHLPHARVKSLRAIDAVDSPAANPSGFFHATDVAHEAEELVSYALGLSEKKPEVAQFDVDPDRVSSFVKKFLDTHNLELKRKERPMDSFSADDIKKFTAAFGAQGPELLLSGKSFEECQLAHLTSQVESLTKQIADGETKHNEQLAAITKERDELQSKLSAAGVNLGEKDPVSFSTPDDPPAPPKKFSNLPDGLQRYAASLGKKPAK